MTASGADAATFERCMSVGGVAVFPADTVYGLACDAGDRLAVERLYRLKRRSPAKPSAVMFFDLGLALAALPELGPRTRAALERLLPGPVSLLLPNPAARWPLACGEDPGTLGLRVVDVPALRGVRWPVLQSSANLAGGPDPCRLADVPEELRRAVEMVVDGGELPGTPSTVIDLRGYECSGEWTIVRSGELPDHAVRTALSDLDQAAVAHAVEPTRDEATIRDDLSGYEALQAALVDAAGPDVARILELGVGTGQTALRLLAAHPRATLVGVDASDAMLDAARAVLPADRVRLHSQRLEATLPAGKYDLVASALTIHHLAAPAKRDLFRRVRERLAPGGRFVLADLVDPSRAVDRPVPLADGLDRPDTLADQLAWLREAGFRVVSEWVQDDLAVVAVTPEG